MIFENAVFIKPDIPFERGFSFENSAPVFRKKFNISEAGTAKLFVCGLGFGYYFINGKKVSDDLFTAPVSNYLKTLWYNEYDVSHLLKNGENVITVLCGNGFFNETLDTKTWGWEKALWRDNPKFIMRLEVDGKTVLVSDESFKCLPHSATFFNQIRRGEYFDANKFDSNIFALEYDDSEWKKAKKDYISPTGVFRKCECEPIRELEVLTPVCTYKTDENKYVFDMGQNISGYIRLTVAGEKGDLLTIRYAEELTEDKKLWNNNMDVYPSYLQNEGFQTDKFICSGEKFTWSPMFTYHGFRYIEIDGLKSLENTVVEAVFVHQDVERRTEFECSDEVINKLFEAGVKSTYSNMFYSLTDCPTREKMAWTNDFMSSTEQLLVNFKSVKLLEKYQQDVFDAMLPDGTLPGIIPSAGWWYGFEIGPIGDGILFEIPYRIYLHTGDDSLLKKSLPYFERYFRYLDSKKDENGLTHHGLGDWSQPEPAFYQPQDPVQVSLINAVFESYFYKIAALADKKFVPKAEQAKRFVIEKFINEQGRCVVDSQCAVSMLIYHDVFDNLKPLKNQLKELVEKQNMHLWCGMVGIRHLLHALNKCGLADYAYKVLAGDGYPGYKAWLDNGATTLYERWEPDMDSSSHNHHMFSDFMSWTIKTMAGLSVSEDGECRFNLDPVFLDDIDYVNCSYNTCKGEIKVRWERTDGKIKLTVEKDESVPLFYKGELIEERKTEVLV